MPWLHLVIPAGFTTFIQNKADEIASRALKDPDSVTVKDIHGILNYPIHC